MMKRLRRGSVHLGSRHRVIANPAGYILNQCAVAPMEFRFENPTSNPRMVLEV